MSSRIWRWAGSRTVALQPADDRDPHPAADLHHLVRNHGRIDHGIARKQLRLLGAERRLQAQLAAVVARRVAQEHGHGDVRAQGLAIADQRVVRVAAGGHPDLVAVDPERRDMAR